MQLTERELAIVKFINEFGFCTILQIREKFSLKQTRCYQLVEKLKTLGLIRHDRILYGKHGVFWLTRKGAAYTDLPALDKIPIGNYEHQLMIANIYLKLQQHYPNMSWISERQLLHDKFYDGVGKSGHVSDGIMICSDSKQIAIEVELTLKGKNRLEKIFKGYGAHLSIAEAWYFCLPELISPLKRLAEKMPFIKIYNLKEWLA